MELYNCEYTIAVAENPGEKWLGVCFFRATVQSCRAAELCYSVGEGDRNLSWPFVNSLCVQPYSTLVIKPLHDFTAVVMEQ